MIEVTPRAAERIRKILAENRPAAGLRIGLVGGGCSGLSYKFRVEKQPRADDNVFEYDGVKIFVDPKSYEHLNGLTLDFRESLLENQFVFENPNAKSTCGCGKSFGL
jgi:iron-sulfur cluster assembly protein